MTERVISFSKGNQASLPRARARFLAKSIRLEEQGPPGVVSAAMLTTGLLLVAAVVWAYVTPVNEVTAAQGAVVPAGYIHQVQHFEGGIVKTIHVRNGDAVQRGDALLTLSAESTVAELNQVRARQDALTLQSLRLEAVLSGVEPDFGDLGEIHPGLGAKERALYSAQQRSHQSRLRVLDAQIGRRQKELLRQENHAASLKRETGLLSQQLEMREALSDKGLVSRAEVLALSAQAAETESDYRELVDGIAVAEDAVTEAELSRAEAEDRFESETRSELGGVTHELVQLEQTVLKLRDRVRRLQVRAPVSGIVKGLSINSVMSVIEGGQLILELVPVGDDLVVEARISPGEVGHVHAGQLAEVKVDSYDPARYGSIDGSVRRISPSTYLDDKGMPYYRAEIALSQNYVGEGDRGLRVVPGMTVQADIVTGQKTVLEYLIRPVSRGFGESFRER
jgi:HlyD family type I secretion membrane fusion protein